MFRFEIGSMVEVYINDMVMQSWENPRHVEDLKEMIEILRQHKLRLNVDKCAFEVGARNFLGYMIMHRGIEVNPNQINAIEHLKCPNNPKDVKKLTGMIAALNRFVSKSGDWCQPFYQLLKKWKGFQWTEECDESFRDLKKYLVSPPILSFLDLGEDLFMYLAMFEHAVSVVLLKNKEGVQKMIYYINKTLVNAETRYLAPRNCHQETAPLFPSAYCVRANGVPTAIFAKKI